MGNKFTSGEKEPHGVLINFKIYNEGNYYESILQSQQPTRSFHLISEIC